LSKVWATVKNEFHEVLPPTIFFLISFHIVVLDRTLMASGSTACHSPPCTQVAWKTAGYIGASLFLHYLEHLIPTWWRLGS